MRVKRSIKGLISIPVDSCCCGSTMDGTKPVGCYEVITRSLTSLVLMMMRTIGRTALQSTTITRPRSRRKKTRPRVADGDKTEHDGEVREATEADTFVDAFNIAFAGLSEKVKNTYRQLFSPVLTTMSLMLLFATAIANDRTLFLAAAAATRVPPPSNVTPSPHLRCTEATAPTSRAKETSLQWPPPGACNERRHASRARKDHASSSRAASADIQPADATKPPPQPESHRHRASRRHLI